MGKMLGRGNYSDVRICQSSIGEIRAVKEIRISSIRHEIHLIKREIEIL
jgi:hypothetical protein